MCTGLLCPNVVCGGCQDESALNATTVYITLDATFLGCLLGKERNARNGELAHNTTVNIFYSHQTPLDKPIMYARTTLSQPKNLLRTP